MPTEEEVNADLEPLLVKLVDVDIEREAAADWGAFLTFPITPTIPAQQVLGENPHRKNAYLIVFGSATGFVRVGTRGQVMNNQGGQLPAGQYKYEARQEIWASSDGTNSMTLTVLDHRYK